MVVLVEDFEAALEKAAPRVSKVQTRRYEALRETFGRNRYVDDRGDNAAP